ncbi:MAG: hypothetical protein AAF378_14425 [Cyanobacteria bacterium P01_A01_bin.84]
MLEIGWFATKLFLKGKMLRNPLFFFRQITIGVSICLILLITLAQTNLPFCIPMTISSLVASASMPFLLKDFKM